MCAAEAKSNEAVRKVKKASREYFPKWTGHFARFGYLAKGCIYAVVGILALSAAIDVGADATGTRGAIREIGRQPLGGVLLVTLMVGLLGYVAWRLVQAVWDTEGKGSSAWGVAQRSGFLASGLVYVALAAYAGALAIGAQSGGNSAQAWTGWFLSFPLGWGLVAIAGGVVVGIGMFNVYRAVTCNFMEGYDTDELSSPARWALQWLGQLGLSARGVAFVLVGLFLLKAAWEVRSAEAKGFEDVLEAVADAPYGPWLLGLFAVGLLAYAGHCFSEARYRNFNTPGERRGSWAAQDAADRATN